MRVWLRFGWTTGKSSTTVFIQVNEQHQQNKKQYKNHKKNTKTFLRMLLHFILSLCLSFTAFVSLFLFLSLSYIVNCFVYIKLYIYSIYLSSKQHVLHFANCLSYIPKHTLTHSPINYIYISDISVNIISIYIMICGMAVPHNSHSPYTYINYI